MVPGLTIAKDDDYLSFFSRGLYAYEGRALVMVDGMQLSDLYFGSYQLGNDFPIHLVKRIEIIRGPGSVIYGGTAELTVINIITRDGSELNGSEVVARYGALASGATGHLDAGFTAGGASRGFEYSVLGYYGRAQRSDDTARYIFADAEYEHRWESAGIQSSDILLKASYQQNTQLKFVYNYYAYNQVRAFDIGDTLDPSNNIYPNVVDGINARKLTYEFTNLGADLSHRFTFFENLTVLPAFNYQYSLPLRRTLPREDVTIQRFKPSLYGDYLLDLGKSRLNFTLGAEYFADLAWVNRPYPNSPFEYLRTSSDDPGRDTVTIHNVAGYGNVKYHLGIESFALNLNAGLRYDWSDLYGDKLNPRLALTAVYRNLHAKVLYSTAYRAPLAGNTAFSRYGLNPDTSLYTRPQDGVAPEQTEVVEVEMGYQFLPGLILTANAFYQRVEDIIEFRYSYTNGDLYSDNGGTLATRGIEGELKYVGRKLSGTLNASYVEPVFSADQNEWAYSYNDPRGGDTYITPDADASGNPTRLELLGVPAFKVFHSTSYQFSRHIGVNVNGLYVSSRYAYDGGGQSRRLSGQYVLSAGVNLTSILDHIDVSLSVQDLFNERLEVATAWYDGNYETLAYKGREVSLRLGLRF